MWCHVMIGHYFADWILLLFAKSELFLIGSWCPLDYVGQKTRAQD
jgi:hypothetical protein